MIYAPRSFAMGRFCFALIKPLRHGFAVPPPLSRGGFGIPESFVFIRKPALFARGSPTRGAGERQRD